MVKNQNFGKWKISNIIFLIHPTLTLRSVVNFHLGIASNWYFSYKNLRKITMQEGSCTPLESTTVYIQMRADTMIHLKYWFRISSILDRTKNSTKTSNTSFERSDSGLFKSWRLGAWHSYWPATPTLYDKLNFLGKGGMASPWYCHAPILQEIYCPLSGLLDKILYVFVLFLLF